MSLIINEIGAEVYQLNQFLRIETGQRKAILDGIEYEVGADDAVVVPAGTSHNFINTGTELLKLYSVYLPPEHKDGIVKATKADEFEEHFDRDGGQKLAWDKLWINQG